MITRSPHDKMYEKPWSDRLCLNWTKHLPLYEYRCSDCQEITSVLVRISSDDTQPSCEHCQSENVEKLISKFSFRASWGDSLNWVPSRESTSDLDETSGASVDKYMGRIKKEMGGQTSPEFNRERREIKDT